MSTLPHQRTLEYRGTVFDGAEDDVVVGGVPRHPDGKQVADPLVEDDLRGNTRVRAPQADGVRQSTMSTATRPSPTQMTRKGRWCSDP